MKAIVFGVFDRFHPGHAYFLSQAKAKCVELTVVVTLPEIVELLKKKRPEHSLDERMDAVRKFDATFKVIPGDATLGAWKVFEPAMPDMVFLGYDQEGIARELDKLGMPYEFIGAHYPEKYKSSLMGKAGQ